MKNAIITTSYKIIRRIFDNPRFKIILKQYFNGEINADSLTKYFLNELPTCSTKNILINFVLKEKDKNKKVQLIKDVNKLIGVSAKNLKTLAVIYRKAYSDVLNISQDFLPLIDIDSTDTNKIKLLNNFAKIYTRSENLYENYRKYYANFDDFLYKVVYYAIPRSHKQRQHFSYSMFTEEVFQLSMIKIAQEVRINHSVYLDVANLMLEKFIKYRKHPVMVERLIKADHNLFIYFVSGSEALAEILKDSNDIALENENTQTKEYLASLWVEANLKMISNSSDDDDFIDNIKAELGFLGAMHETSRTNAGLRLLKLINEKNKAN